MSNNETNNTIGIDNTISINDITFSGTFNQLDQDFPNWRLELGNCNDLRDMLRDRAQGLNKDQFHLKMRLWTVVKCAIESALVKKALEK